MKEEEENNIIEKELTCYLVINWYTKNGDMKLRKTKPKKIAPMEIVIELNINLVIPEKKMYKADAEVTLSEEKVDDIIVSQL